MNTENKQTDRSRAAVNNQRHVSGYNAGHVTGCAPWRASYCLQTTIYIN